MSPDLREELKQRKPFASIEHEAELSILRTGMLLQDAFERLVKPYGISATQYNVLRILRGSEPVGLCRYELKARMLTRMPDVTRLLDRMEELELVTRERSTEDRRLVRTRITEKGMDILRELEDVVEEEHRRRMGHLSREQLETLIRLLGAVREQV